MAIYTPRGLRIRIAIPYAFALMARLHPKVSPFRILKTTEGIEYLPGMLAFTFGIIAFIMKLSPMHIGLVVGGVQLIGVLTNLFGFYLIPGLIPLATLFSYFAGYGIFLITVLVVGFVFTGWQGLLAYLIGKLAAALVSQVLQFWQTSRYYKMSGHAFTTSEVHFFNAYRLHASQVGITTDIALSDKEMEENHWGPTFEAFAIEWPQVVRKFTSD
jgi:hypothetical protein